MSFPITIAPAILEKIIGLLVPLFLTETGGDLLAAQHAARCLLADYDVETEEELRLAAEIIGFGFGALEFLSQSMAPGLTMNAVLRLRGSANAQHRSANQCQRTLDKLRKDRRIAKAEARNSRPAQDTERKEIVGPKRMMSNDRPSSSEKAPSDVSPIDLSRPDLSRPDLSSSRQQRRAAERKAEKAKRKQAEFIRREAMRTTRAIPGNPTIIPPQPPSPNHPGAVSLTPVRGNPPL